MSDDLLSKLNQQQRAAITYGERPLLVWLQCPLPSCKSSQPWISAWKEAAVTLDFP